VPPELAAERRAADQRGEEIFDAIEVQRKVAHSYRLVVDRLQDREWIVVLDGTQPVEDIAAEVHRLALESCAGAGEKAP
jgi:thymidylate kinase